jgi:hypothetical protein
MYEVKAYEFNPVFDVQSGTVSFQEATGVAIGTPLHISMSHSRAMGFPYTHR